MEVPAFGDEDLRRIVKEKKPLTHVQEKEEDKFSKLITFRQTVELIIHTVNGNEKWAVLDLFKPPELHPNNPITERHVDLSGPNWIVLGMFGGYKSALIQTEQGVECQEEIEEALDKFPRAKFILAIGVAYGFDPKTKYCDVLVSKFIDGVGNIKYESDNSIISRASSRRFNEVSKTLRNVFARNVETWGDFKCTKEGRCSIAHSGVIISDKVLVNNKEVRNEIKRNAPEALGGEMEGVVLCKIKQSLAKRNNREIDVIIIKGVADYADGTKGKEWQLTAAMAAVKYAEYALKSTEGKLFTEGDLQDDARVISTPSSGESALMRYANQCLKPHYKKDSICRDDKFSMNVCSEFIKLALIPKDKTKCEDDVSSKASLHFSVDKNLEAKTPLGLNEVITSDTKFVLVEGCPGFGKTTLSWELCRRWDTFSSLNHYKIVLLLKLREPGVHNATSLNELFSICYVDEDLCKEVVGEALRSLGNGILFVFDGYDELLSSVIRNNKSLIMKLINGSCLPCATRVVTSRPSALHYNKHFPAEFRHIEILGFTDECKERFAEIAFKSEPDLLKQFKVFMVSNPIINSLMYIPFNCAILAQVYKDIRNSRELIPKTMTQLYTILTEALILKHMTSSGKWDEDSSELPDLNHLSNDISTDFERVCELAYEGLFKEDVQLEFSKSDVGDGFQHLGLMTETKERNMGVTTSYSFPHLSIQEFLAAWHVSCHSDLVYEAFSKIVSLYGDIIPHLRVFGQFLCGIIGYYEIFIHKIPDLFPYILHCLYEIKDISKLYPIYIPNLHLSTPLDAYVFGYCLVRVPIQCQSVVINTSLKMLLHSLHSLSEKTNGATLGTINDLCIFGKHTSSMKLKSRTKYLPKLHVKSFSPCQISSPLVPVLAELISVSSGLTLVDLSFSESCENDYLLFQSIQHIANLEKFYLTCCTLTQKGVQELSKIITTSSTLTSLRLELHPLLLCEAESSEEHKLLVSVLSTSFELYSALIRASTTISILHTNIPCITNIDVCFLVFSSTYHLHPLEVLRYFRYSSCNVEMNSIESLAIPARIDDLLIAMPQYCCNLIMGLNDSLHLNHSIKELTFKHKFYLRRYSSFRDCIARALRRDPAVPRHNLRRSQSLCDLRTLHFPHRHQLLQQQSISSLSLLSSGWRHISPRSQVSCYPYQSCPNLLEMQALKNMHPLLQEALGYNELSINEFYLHYCYP